MAPALAAGNTLVCKPPHQNPLSNLLMARCFDGLPPGVVNVVTGGPETGEALVRHLHAFIREVRPTQKEWEYGVDFLTRTGHMCDDKRQEFILLSDTLGVSMLVDAINHPVPEGATETTVLGPFFVQAAPEKNIGDDISGKMEGDPILVTGSVSTVDGQPLAGAVVDVWHSDDDGYYDVQQLDKIGDLTMRARFHTDANGRFAFTGLKSGTYEIKETQPYGYTSGQDSVGTIDGTPTGTHDDDVGDRFFNIYLGVGKTGVNYNFAELVPDAPS